MMIRKILFLILICYTGQLVLIAQTRERVYVQTDKQSYLSGELLWLKLYTTDADGKLQVLSKIGYVELIRDSIPEVQIKVDIQNGTGAGWIELPVMLPTGYYRMIAYTRYMRNEGENIFFEKKIAVINPVHQNAFLNANEATTTFSFASYEKNNASFGLSTNKSSFRKRDKGEIRLNGLPAENISLGISIAGLDPSLETTPTIDKWLHQLETQGKPAMEARYLPEYEGAIIDGTMVDIRTGASAADENALCLLSFPGPELQLFAGQPFTSGDVSFYTQCVTGKKELTTTAIASSDKKYRINLQSSYATHSPELLPDLMPDSTWLEYLKIRNLSIQVTYAFLADSLSKIRELATCSSLLPQKRYVLDNYTRFPNMEEVFIEFITNAGIRRTDAGRKFSMLNELTGNNSTNTLVLLDNVPVTDHELMINYNPLTIKMIDMYFGRYVFGGYAFDGVIAFYSYDNDYPGITFSENTQVFDYEGTQPYRYFYAPHYGETGATSPLPDFRHTLLWEPDVNTNGQQTMIIPFTTSDIPGKYVITIEGAGENGSVFHARQTIVVE
ncbi:MAG: hypothetical protein LBE56_02495 [Tannerella sp.]|jgi:hypothetical protein|nr:hypothetical protein [Tannerella sp.]